MKFTQLQIVRLVEEAYRLDLLETSRFGYKIKTEILPKCHIILDNRSGYDAVTISIENTRDFKTDGLNVFEAISTSTDSADNAFIYDGPWVKPIENYFTELENDVATAHKRLLEIEAEQQQKMAKIEEARVQRFRDAFNG